MVIQICSYNSHLIDRHSLCLYFDWFRHNSTIIFSSIFSVVFSPHSLLLFSFFVSFFIRYLVCYSVSMISSIASLFVASPFLSVLLCSCDDFKNSVFSVLFALSLVFLFFSPQFFIFFFYFVKFFSLLPRFFACCFCSSRQSNRGLSDISKHLLHGST